MNGAENEIKLVRVDTSECEPWAYHNRDPSWFEGDEALKLKASIESTGQQQAGLARRSNKNGKAKFEIIFGVRRWNACRQLGRKFLVRIIPESESDVVCAKLMEDENEASQNITQLERGISYKRLIEEGVFATQVEISDYLSVSKQFVNKLITSAEVFENEILNKPLKPHLRQLSVVNCLALNSALKTNGAKNKFERALAKATEEELASCSELVKLLMDSVKKSDKETERVLLKSGRAKVATCKTNSKGDLTLKLNLNNLNDERIEELSAAFKGYLKERSKPADK